MGTRILVVGAGAIGGYLGGRLHEADADVTLLARPGRAAAIASHGLRISSPHGDCHVFPRTVTAPQLDGTYDLVLVCVKAYSLDVAMSDMAPAIAENTSLIPMMNGLSHIDMLARRFGRARLLGGMCLLTATMEPEGDILHLLPPHEVVFGELDGAPGARTDRIEALFAPAKFDARASGRIVAEMWEKLVLLATNAGATCLMRASIGEIVASPGGRGTILELLAECEALATAVGHPPRPAFMDFTRSLLTAEGSALKASMLRDIERGGPTEGEHVFGHLAALAAIHGTPSRLLGAARCHMAAYERVRSASLAGATATVQPG